ncbi:uncharacterized [Tachysurus ichikawai]
MSIISGLLSMFLNWDMEDKSQPQNSWCLSLLLFMLSPRSSNIQLTIHLAMNQWPDTLLEAPHDTDQREKEREQNA